MTCGSCFGGHSVQPPLQSTPERGSRAGVKLPEAKRGVVRLPRRRVGERSFAWTARFRRLARDDEWWPATLAGFHCLLFVLLMLKRGVS